jgi:hypothetical protein
MVIVPSLSCGQRSLVLVTVNAPQGAAEYSDTLLVITANGQETITFEKASFTDGVYRAGVYLPSDMSGPVPFTAEVVLGGCQIATGGPVVSPDVSSGATVSLAIDLTAKAGPCLPADGGAASGGTGGEKGSGGSGTGGVTAGAGGGGGKGGGSATGGVTGTGGAVGSGGTSGCTCPDPNEICAPGTTSFCSCPQSDSAACAGTCGAVTNICNQPVQCPGTCPAS